MKKPKIFEKEGLKDFSKLMIGTVIVVSIFIGILGEEKNNTIVEIFIPDSQKSPF